MSEKVMLTAEQAEAIEYSKANSDNPWWLLDAHANDPNSWCHKYKGINGMHIGSLAQAIYIGYEIEQSEFQPGDKVVPIELEHGEKPSVSVLKKVKEGTREESWWYEDGQWDYAIDFRHATPEEIYWLETLDRDFIADFRIGDAVVNKNWQFQWITKDRHIESAKRVYQEDVVRFIYPVESYKPFFKEDAK